MGPLEYHRKYGIITAEDGRRMIAASVRPGFGPLYAACKCLIERWGNYDFESPTDAAIIDSMRAALREANGGAP